MHKLTIGESLGSDGIDDPVGLILTLFDSQLSQIIHIDGLKAITSITKNTKNGQVAQRPGNVIDQDIFFAEENRRTQDGVRYPGLDQATFQAGFAAEIWQG